MKRTAHTLVSREDGTTGEVVTLQDVEREFSPKFDAVNERIEKATEQLEAARSDEDAEAVQTATKAIEAIEAEVRDLTKDRDARLRESEYQNTLNRVDTLEKALEAARQPAGDFVLAGAPAAQQQNIFGEDAEHSFFATAKKAIESGQPDAIELWQEATAEKAMTQSEGSTGGYLVPAQIASELLQIKEQENVLRPLFNSIDVSSDTLRIASITQGLLAGWVAELAEKPEGEFKFGEISVNTFWKAGLAVVSNQLLRNSNPSIDRLIYSDLGKRLAALEEAAFIAGTGTNQPLGILNTPGVQHAGDGHPDNPGGASELTGTGVDDLLDAIVDGITAVYSRYYGAPNVIIMHPRTWGRIVKERKADATAEYFVGPPGSRSATDGLPGFGNASTPRGSLFGLPVVTTRHVPTNAGDDDNESRVIIGNSSEALVLDHADVSLDSSEHVHFTTNQTVFRAEDAVGFTAARYPLAWYVVGGTGLANG